MHEVFVTKVRQGEAEIRLSFFGQADLDPAGIPKLLSSEKWRNRLFFRAASDPQLTLKIRQKVKRQEELLQTLQELAEDLQVLRG